jgi:hypothetical protein
MPYNKKTWVKNEIINAAALNNMEQGISDVHDIILGFQEVIDAIPDTTDYMTKSTYDPDEDEKITSAVTADKLSDGASGKTYTNITSVMDSKIATHTANAAAHGTVYTDAMAKAAIDADTAHATSASHNYRTNEEIQDVCANFLVEGDNVNLTYNDAANTLTISVPTAGLTTADRTKFDSIEPGATADQTAAEIIALINASNLKIDADNVNVTAGSGLTQEQLDKLNSIETGATADMTGTEIVDAINSSTSVINAININHGNFATIIERGFIGEVVSGDSVRVYIPRAGTIQSVTILSATRPYGEDLIVDVRKNGIATTNSIFIADVPIVLTTSAGLIQGNVYATVGQIDSSQATVVPGDVLRAFVTQSGNVVDLSICIEVLF